MDWAAYKALCARPDVFSRALLEWTRSRVADDALQAVFDTLLNQPPIGKPSDFSGDARTDMFVVRFDTGQAQRIIDRLAGDGLDRRQRHAVVVWREYLAMFAGADSEQYGLLGEMMQPQERVTALMQAFDARDLDAIEACFTPDAVYHNIPMEPVTGSAAIRASLAPFLGMASEIRFEVLQSAANGSVVMNERVDRFLVNGRWIAVRVMGVFEVSAAGITAWRDYFDLAEFQQQMGGLGAVARHQVESEVAGSVWKVEVAAGDAVAAGDVLMILESMKMEIPVESPVDGVVEALLVAPEDQVAEEQVLAVVVSG